MRIAMFVLLLLSGFFSVNVRAEMQGLVSRPEKNGLSQLAIKIETFRFYDWEVDTSARGAQAQQCHITLKGVSKDRIVVTMRLSMLQPADDAPREQVSDLSDVFQSTKQHQRQTLTILKVSATQGLPSFPDKHRPLHINSAWLETTHASTLGKIKKANVSAQAFLGGAEGIRLFLSILKGLKEEGLIIGIRIKGASHAQIFKAPRPNAQVLMKLRPCFEKRKVTVTF